MAGRRTMKDEAVMAAVVNKSWDIVRDYLTNQGISLEKKRDMALRIAERTIPKDINVEGNLVISELLKKFEDK